MPYVGWSGVTDQTNTSTGGGARVVADVSSAVSTGFSVGGEGVVDRYTGVPPPPSSGYLLQETGFEDFIIQESGSPPIRIILV